LSIDLATKAHLRGLLDKREYLKALDRLEVKKTLEGHYDWVLRERLIKHAPDIINQNAYAGSTSRLKRMIKDGLENSQVHKRGIS
jgi:hypothetical protein